MKPRALAGLVLVLAVGWAACSPPPRLAPSSTPAARPATARGAPAQLKIGLVVFLSGGAAAPFGLPARNGAEVMIEAINSGQAPAPYSTPGVAGVPLVAVFADEAGGAEKQAAELRRLFLEEKVDLLIGYTSSSSCLAAAPVAEELKKLTVVFDCGTSRLFEERGYRYVFRTNAHQAIDSLGGARYLLRVRPDLESIAGINQNYSWGQDSWAHFRDTLLKLKPDVQVVGEQFPKLGAGDYAAEIAALGRARPQAIHTSFWGADLDQLIAQAAPRGLFREARLLMSVGESALPGLARQVPQGAIVGGHGPHGVMAPPGPLDDWLVKLYRDRYKVRPTYPVYHMAQALLGVKLAFEKAVEQQSNTWPTVEQVIQAFEYMEYPTPSGSIQMAIGRGHQAIEPAVYGTAGDFDSNAREVQLTDVVIYPAGCVNPPDGTTTEQWIRNGFPGADCP